MTDKEKAGEVNAAQRAPANPAVVESAHEKVAADEPLNRREEQALADQDALDQARGYREIEWQPGVTIFQHIATLHTELDERAMRRYVNALASPDVTRLVPRAGG
jgi:hypothetical protein